MSKEKVKKEEIKTTATATINKDIAKAFTLTKAKEKRRYALNNVYFDAETKELVVSNGTSLIIITIKPTGLGFEIYTLETGLYDIVGDRLFKKEKAEEMIFPKYQDIVPETKEVCSGKALRGIIDCMIKKQVYIDIWKFGAVLKILDKISCNWIFSNMSPTSPVLMETENVSYKIKYIMMPYNP